jgi:hypothetical protein
MGLLKDTGLLVVGAAAGIAAGVMTAADPGEVVYQVPRAAVDVSSAQYDDLLRVVGVDVDQVCAFVDGDRYVLSLSVRGQAREVEVIDSKAYEAIISWGIDAGAWSGNVGEAQQVCGYRDEDGRTIATAIGVRSSRADKLPDSDRGLMLLGVKQ